MRLCLAAPARRLVLLGLLLAAIGLVGCGSGGEGDGGNGGTNNRTLTGRVTNASNGQPIGNATVRAAGRTTTTDPATGTYTLTGLPSDADLTVTFSATGYEEDSVTVTDRDLDELDHALVPDNGGGFPITQPPPPPDFGSVGL